MESSLDVLWVRITIGVVIALAVYQVAFLLIKYVLKPSNLWWFPICLCNLCIFLWLALWVIPDQTKLLGVLASGVQWGLFGIVLYTFDLGKKHWPKGW